MSNYIRKAKRKERLAHRCKKCHDKLIEKYGYGWVCIRCGYEEPFEVEE